MQYQLLYKNHIKVLEELKIKNKLIETLNREQKQNNNINKSDSSSDNNINDSDSSSNKSDSHIKSKKHITNKSDKVKSKVDDVEDENDADEDSNSNNNNNSYDEEEDINNSDNDSDDLQLNIDDYEDDTATTDVIDSNTKLKNIKKRSISSITSSTTNSLLIDNRIEIYESDVLELLLIIENR